MPLKKGDLIITKINSIYEVVKDETAVGVEVRRLNASAYGHVWTMVWSHKSKEAKIITSKEGKKKIYEYLNMLFLGEID